MCCVVLASRLEGNEVNEPWFNHLVVSTGTFERLLFGGVNGRGTDNGTSTDGG